LKYEVNLTYTFIVEADNVNDALNMGFDLLVDKIDYEGCALIDGIQIRKRGL